jgi:hypothetical protein
MCHPQVRESQLSGKHKTLMFKRTRVNAEDPQD